MMMQDLKSFIVVTLSACLVVIIAVTCALSISGGGRVPESSAVATGEKVAPEAPLAASDKPTEAPAPQRTGEGARAAETQAEQSSNTAIAPSPSDLRIEVVKPGDIRAFTFPMVPSVTNAMYGWVRSPLSETPAELYKFALEKAVLRYYGENPEPYIVGTIPGYIDPFDMFEVSSSRMKGGTLIFTVKHLRKQAEALGCPSAARAYYTILVSALPPGTQTMVVTFEGWVYSGADGRIDSWKEGESSAEDIKVSINTIRCDNYVPEPRR